MTTDYSFESLGWYGFEGLISTLFRRILGAGLSAFSGSADQGRDATFNGRAPYPGEHEQWDGDWILQCKYKSIDLRNRDDLVNELKRDLKKELAKVSQKYRHQCDNFLLITNLPLSASEKDELIREAQGFKDGLRLGTVGRIDLEQLLNLNPQVARSFPSLLSVRHLRELLNHGIHQRSVEYMDQVHEGLQRFVVTNAYRRAHEMLSKQHFCVLTGSPKMGKSVTADALNAAFAVDGFEIVEIRNVKDLEDAVEPGRKMVFYCDDVFGDLTMLPERRNDWISGIARRIRTLRPERKLLWTTRNYILEEAIGSSRLTEELPDFIKNDTVKVDVGSLTRIEKAEILYKHAKHSSIGNGEKDTIKKYCLQIVDHQNFSPEGIRQLCTRRLSEIASERSTQGSWNRISKFFSEPGNEWRRAYDALDQHERLICLLLTSLNSPVPINELKSAFERESSEIDAKKFDDVLRKIDGSFIRRNVDYLGKVRIQYYHPSIKDLVIGFLSENGATRRRFIETLSVDGLGTLIPSGKANSRGNGSENHRLKIESDDDLQVLNEVLRERLLPTMKFDAALVLSERLMDAVNAGDGSRGDTIAIMVLEAFIECICGEEFVVQNCSRSFSNWITLLQNLKIMITASKRDWVPVSLVHLVRSPPSHVTPLQFLKVASLLKMMVSPVIIGKYLTKKKLEGARDEVQGSIDGAVAARFDDTKEEYYDDCIAWHRAYGSLLEDCGLLSECKIKIERISEFKDKFDEVPTEQEFAERQSEGQYDSWKDDQHDKELADREIEDIFNDL